MKREAGLAGAEVCINNEGMVKLQEIILRSDRNNSVTVLLVINSSM